jgi:hypothetical protein
MMDTNPSNIQEPKMNSHERFREGVKERYGFSGWAGRVAAPNGPLRYKFLPKVDAIADYSHEKRAAIPDAGHTFIDYYQHKTKPDIRIAVTIAEYHSIADAHDGLVEHLCHCMAPLLPRAAECGIAAGDIGFGGYEKMQTAVFFVRFNQLVKVNSVGKKDISVKDVAETIDRQIQEHHQKK